VQKSWATLGWPKHLVGLKMAAGCSGFILTVTATYLVIGFVVALWGIASLVAG